MIKFVSIKNKRILSAILAVSFLMSLAPVSTPKLSAAEVLPICQVEFFSDINHTVEYVDTVSNIFKTGNAVATYSGNSRWTASIPGATWIWSSYHVEDTKATTTALFSRDISIGSIESATLVIAADNLYNLRINGMTAVASPNTNFVEGDTFPNFGEAHTYEIPVSFFTSGKNNFVFSVTNMAIEEADQMPEHNPAGLLYKLVIKGRNISGIGSSNVNCQTTNTPPTISLVGANPMEITVGTPFVDPGATATDTEDGDLTTSIVKTGTVNASTTGTYILDYSVTDSGGLSASTTRTVIVKPAGCTSNCGGGGGNNNPSVTLGSNPSTITEGASSTLSWNSSNTSSCSATWTSATSTSGTKVVSPLTTTSYSISCTGSNGTVSATTTVTVNPKVTNTPPVITLIGSNPFEIIINNPFVDPGATSTDAEDGNLTSQIVRTGTVNASTTGTYVLTYSVTDSGGLSASTTRTVIVKPAGCTSNCGGGGGSTNNPPTITLIGNNPFIITIGTNFVDPGATALDTEDGNLTSAIKVSGSVSTTTISTSTITYSVYDSKGLGATTTRTVVVVPVSTSTKPICSDGVDNDGDGKVDSSDPGCHSDNDPNNNGSYDPNDNDETDQTSGCTSNCGGGGGGGGGGGSSLSGSRRRPIVVGEIAGATSCTYLRDYLRRDWNNDSVEMLKLKSFLNVFEKENLSLTADFDQATFDAVSRFQNKYESDILTPWGHTAPTGFVYILTKKKINEIYCNTILTLTEDNVNEINNFRAFLESLKNGSNSTIINGSLSTSTLPVIINDLVGQNVLDSVDPVVLSIKDSTSTPSIIKDAAISLLAFPSGIQDCLLAGSTKCLIAFIVLIVIIAVIAYVIGSMSRFQERRNIIRIRTFLAGCAVILLLSFITRTYCLVWPFIITLIASFITRFFIENGSDDEGYPTSEDAPLPKEEDIKPIDQDSPLL